MSNPNGLKNYVTLLTRPHCKWASFWRPNPARARNNKPEPDIYFWSPI